MTPTPASPSPQPASPQPASPPLPGGTAALLDEFLAAWNDRDLAGVVACLADDVTLCGSDGITVRGREAVAAVFAEQLAGDPELTIEQIATRGNRGFGYFWYAPAADGTMLRGVDVYTVRDGRIVAKDVLSKIA